MVAMGECLLSLGLGIIAHFTGHMVISGDDVIFIDLHQEEEGQWAVQVVEEGPEGVEDLVAAVGLVAAVDLVAAEEDNEFRFPFC